MYRCSRNSAFHDDPLLSFFISFQGFFFTFYLGENTPGVTTISDVAIVWGQDGALFLKVPEVWGKGERNTSTIVGHCILQSKILALEKTLA
jgi:hypothetical protein